MAKVVIVVRKKELGAWRVNGMQPQCREVRVENDEYEREQQRLAKQIKRVVVLIKKRPYLRILCGSKTRSHSGTLST